MDDGLIVDSSCDEKSRLGVIVDQEPDNSWICIYIRWRGIIGLEFIFAIYP